MQDSLDGFDSRKAWKLGIAGVLMVVALSLVGKVVETNDAKDVMVVQAPVSGNFSFYTTAGLKGQWFGSTTSYPKRDIYRFSLPVRFNDAGHGTMWGSIQYEIPLTDSLLRSLHVKFGSREAIQQQIVQTVVNKSIYLTGTLMSSKESYAERRNDLIRYVEDQVQNGVYRTKTREQRMIDQISGAEKTAAVVEIVNGPDGTPQRQEISVLNSFGIVTSNFSIDSLPYDNEVEGQIKQQQKLAMDIQTSIAESRQAEQRAITAKKNGEADAAKAKWDQEIIKAKEVTAAQQRLAVATLDAQAAEQKKRKDILEGQGEAEKRRLIYASDGALAQKLEAWVKVNTTYAENFSKYQGAWTPGVVMGGNGSNSTRSGSGAMDFMDLLTVKTARDLSLDLGQSRAKP
ncbi:MAG: hypothetical protein AAB617_00185 [Patescibacteria group bacterium]